MNEARPVTIVLNGETIAVNADASLAAVLLSRGQRTFRRSVDGESRGPLCGMGICFECIVTVDGVPGVRACLEPVRDGMRVDTDA
jgi:sarcosine oxidase subunit alpha